MDESLNTSAFRLYFLISLSVFKSNTSTAGSVTCFTSAVEFMEYLLLYYHAPRTPEEWTCDIGTCSKPTVDMFKSHVLRVEDFTIGRAQILILCRWFRYRFTPKISLGFSFFQQILSLPTKISLCMYNIALQAISFTPLSTTQRRLHLSTWTRKVDTTVLLADTPPSLVRHASCQFGYGRRGASWGSSK